MSENFFIKAGYKENIVNGAPKEVYNEAPAGNAYQFSVFSIVRDYIKQNPEVKSIIDIGCGSAYKINHFLRNLPIEITGVDQGFAVESGKNKYPYMHWIEDDFSRPASKELGSFDLIISSDVIEHLVNPDLLLDRIRMCMKADSVVFLSTPERDLVRGYDSMGPPANPLHVREWNKLELSDYISSRGFQIIEHIIVAAKKLTPREKLQSFLGKLNNDTCQLIVFKLNDSE
jgi:SAM-dependent methyltransferase